MGEKSGNVSGKSDESAGLWAGCVWEDSFARAADLR